MTDPVAVLRAVYDFINTPYFIGHDPDTIAPCDDINGFDRRMGTPALHDVGNKVALRVRDPLLPPDLFDGYAQTEFWVDTAFKRPGMRVIWALAALASAPKQILAWPQRKPSLSALGSSVLTACCSKLLGLPAESSFATTELSAKA